MGIVFCPSCFLEGSGEKAFLGFEFQVLLLGLGPAGVYRGLGVRQGHGGLEVMEGERERGGWRTSYRPTHGSHGWLTWTFGNEMSWRVL